MRILVATLLTLAALTALTPNVQAVYICGHQADAQDKIIGDDPIWRSHCTTENINQVNLDCEVTVTVDTDGITYPARCDQIIPCNPCCGYCPPPIDSTAAASGPCHTVGSPVLDAGFGVQCTAAGSECHAVTATFGTIEDFLSPDAGCSTSLWPPYDCVQDCDGPPTASAAAPCQVTSALPGDVSATCTVLFCDVGPVVTDGAYDHVASCWSPLVCVMEPCPGSGRIEV